MQHAICMYISCTGKTIVQYVSFVGEKLLLSYSVRYVQLFEQNYLNELIIL